MLTAAAAVRPDAVQLNAATMLPDVAATAFAATAVFVSPEDMGYLCIRDCDHGVQGLQPWAVGMKQ